MKKQSYTIALIACLMVSLCGCSGLSGQDSGFVPVYIAKDDQISDATARQILQNNELGASLFGWH